MFKIIFTLSVCFLLLFLIYSILPTVLIRLSGNGISKRLNNSNGIALTFDDGPNPKYTIQLLDLLKRYDIKATFFVVGQKVLQHPEIIKRMKNEGHKIGIHHFKHISSWILSPFHLWKSVKMTEKAIEECTNEKVSLYRPPWGHFNLFTPFICKKYKVVMWSHIFGDWKVERCKNNLLDQLRVVTDDGSILLLHDCGKTWGADELAPQFMLEALEIFIEERMKEGTIFIPVNEN